MPAKTVHNQDKIDFIRKIMKRKIRETRQLDTPACKRLAPQVNLSYATLFKALNGEFTLRTVRRMMQAGWFTNGEYSRAQQNTGDSQHRRRSRRTNDNSQQSAREHAAFRRGYNQGRTEGFNQARGVNNASDTRAYNRGYSDGRRDERNNRPAPSGPSGLPVDRLQSLLNMTVNRGAAQGEVVAARRAVGKSLAKWIKEKFGQDVDVQVS